MKILYISSSIIPSKTANSVHVMKMVSALKENKNEVTLIATRGKSNDNIFEYYNIKNRFKIHLTKNRKFFSWLSRLICSLKNVKGHDIIFTRWPLAAAIISLFFNKKIILEYHSYPTSIIQKFLLKTILKSNNIIRYIFITHSLKEYFISRHENLNYKDCLVIPDGADIDTKAKVTPFVDKSTLQCCYVGSFIEGKGVDTVVKVANHIKDVQFHIVGGSSQEIEYYKTLQLFNNITWYGFLKQKDAMKVIDNSHIALLPNKKNVYIKNNDIGKWTSPLKMFEYMSKGKAIIASDLPVIREVLTDKENCLLVESENIESWVCAIGEIQRNSLLYKKLAINAKNDLDNKYSWRNRAENALNGIVIN